MSKVSEWAACADLPTAEMRARCEAECFEEAYARNAGSKKITPTMREREMLHILQERLYSDAPRWYWAIREAGGPNRRRLDGYISGVLAGYAMKFDHRIRPILIALDNGAKRGVYLGPFPPGPLVYHVGKRPPDRRRREDMKAALKAAQKAEADAADKRARREAADAAWASFQAKAAAAHAAAETPGE